MSDAHTIVVRGLRKVYRSGFFRIPFVGLDSLDLAVHPGEIFGFVGPNGAGKTTAIKILVGLQAATAGEVQLLGLPHTDIRAKRDLGFLPERPYFYEHLSARELLTFYGQLFDLAGPALAQRVDALLERVDLTAFADSPLHTYSKGMLQRAGIAQALINKPRLLILDEPMSGLDPLGRMLVKDILLEEKAKGTTVFLSSHVLGDVELLADRVGLLIQGRLQGCGTVEELVGTSIHHVDCAFRLAGPVELPGTEISREGGLVQVRLSPEQVDEALDRVRASGGKVIQVLPARSTLEELVAREVLRSREVSP
jgi:ABC-2 type transport system ATP-binding protein